MRQKVLFLTLLFIISVNLVFANPLVSGDPVKLIYDENYYVATTSGLRIISETGDILHFLQIDGITDFYVSDNIYITTNDQKFPNVIAYSKSLEKLWEFMPTMVVFDPSLVWHEKETITWKIKEHNGFVYVASGYTLYKLKEGKSVANFTVTNDIWDIYIENDLRIATQEGKAYILDFDLNLKNEIFACEEIEIKNPVSNYSEGTFTRSAWQIINDNIACENGHVYRMNKEPFEAVRYTRSFITNYYFNINRPTSINDQLYKNVKLLETDKGIIIYSDERIYYDDWTLSLDIKDVSYHDKFIYILTGTDTQIIKKIDLNGKEVSEIVTKSLCTPDNVKLLAGNKILLADKCEIKLLDKKINWYIPTLPEKDILKINNVNYIYRDSLNNKGFYSVVAKTAKTLWTYILPVTLREKGSLREIFPAGDNLLLWYSGNEDKLIVLYSDGTSKELKATDRTYAGDLDKYFLNPATKKEILEYDQTVFEMIPWEIIDGRIGEAYENYGTEYVDMMLQKIDKFPYPVGVLALARDFREEEYLLRQNIQDISLCNLNDDGIPDILISAEEIVVARDGKTLEELWMVDSNPWRYEQPYFKSQKNNFTVDWLKERYSLFCIGDVNKDNIQEMFAYSYDHFGFLESFNNTYVWKWNRSLRNINIEDVDVIDYNGDGILETKLPIWRQDQPTLTQIIDYNNNILAEFDLGEYILISGFGDFDGDSKKEDLLYYDDFGTILRIKSETMDFLINKGRNFWETKDKFGYHSPAAAKDMNNDGKDDLVYLMVERDGIAVLEYYDIYNDAIIETILITGDYDKNEFYEWQYTNAIQFFDNKLIFSVPSVNMQTKPMACSFDTVNNEIISCIHKEIKTILNENTLLGIDGNMYYLDKMQGTPVIESGDDVSVKMEDTYVSVYSNNRISAAGLESVNFKLNPGDYDITVVGLNKEGIESRFTGHVTVTGISIVSIINILFIALILLIIIIKVVKWKLSK